MGLWFTELRFEGVNIEVRIEKVVYEGRTAFQRLGIYDTVAFGRILTLDDVIQTTEIDEYLYHESLVHVPLFAHENPKTVLIIGGGDGGSLREALKHPVEKVTVVDIDEGVIDAARRFMPLWSGGYDDERAEIIIADGFKFVEERNARYDVVIVDSTDPEGPGKDLFAEDFYKGIGCILNEGGIMAAQTEGPLVMPSLVRKIYRRVARAFPVAKLYTAPVPTYPGALWGASLPHLFSSDPEKPKRLSDETWGLKYYSPAIHSKAFLLSPKLKKDILGG